LLLFYRKSVDVNQYAKRGETIDYLTVRANRECLWTVSRSSSFLPACSPTSVKRTWQLRNKAIRRTYVRPPGNFACRLRSLLSHPQSAEYVNRRALWDTLYVSDRVKSYKIDGPDGDPLAPLTFHSHLWYMMPLLKTGRCVFVPHASSPWTDDNDGVRAPFHLSSWINRRKMRTILERLYA